MVIVGICFSWLLYGFPRADMDLHMGAFFARAFAAFVFLIANAVLY